MWRPQYVDIIVIIFALSSCMHALLTVLNLVPGGATVQCHVSFFS